MIFAVFRGVELRKMKFAVNSQ